MDGKIDIKFHDDGYFILQTSKYIFHLDKKTHIEKLGYLISKYEELKHENNRLECENELLKNSLEMRDGEKIEYTDNNDNMIKKDKHRFTYEYDEHNGNLLDNQYGTFYPIEDSEENIDLLCTRLNSLVKDNNRLKEIIMHSYETIICENCKYCEINSQIGRYGVESDYKCLKERDCSKMLYVNSCDDFDVDTVCERFFDEDKILF